MKYKNELDKINSGQANSLIVKLENGDSAAKEEKRTNAVACNQTHTFVNEVNAFAKSKSSRCGNQVPKSLAGHPCLYKMRSCNEEITILP